MWGAIIGSHGISLSQLPAVPTVGAGGGGTEAREAGYRSVKLPFIGVLRPGSGAKCRVPGAHTTAGTQL